MENLILIILAAGSIMGILSFILHRAFGNVLVAILPQALTLLGGIGFSIYSYFTAPSDAWIGLGLMIIGLIIAGVVALAFITFLVLDAIF